MNQISTLQNNFTTFYPYKFDATNPNFLFSKIKITKPVTCFNPSHAISQDYSTKHKTLLVESFHEHQRFKELLARLNKKGSCPLQMLEDDGDWSRDHFWTVIRFLRQSSRSDEILQVFNMWKDRENSRINEFNYEKIIEMLGEEGLMEDAVLAFTDMKTFCLSPSLQVYNSLIHGFARNGKFDDALFHLNQMKETNLTLESDTYDGLIQAYGKFKMYDEMGMCLKKMEMDGCTPDRITYNVLIEEFARAGLLTRMEKAYQRTRMERIDLKSSALIAMVEAYANFGVVDKMETVMKRVRTNTRDFNEDLVRKIALVYIENFMFSRLEKLAYYITKRSGRTDMVWCLLLLSNACLLSQQGIDIVVREMEEAEVLWNIMFINIVLLAYLKIKDFTHLGIFLTNLGNHVVKPDIVTVGILFDAIDKGFRGSGTIEKWRRTGLLCRSVEMETDPLVLAAFGKGQFLRKCEEAYLSLEPGTREKKKWSYSDLIDLVVAKKNVKKSQLEEDK